MALNQRSDGATSTLSGETVVAIARRYWWVSTLVLILVALAAGGRYLTAPRAYLVSQDLNVALIPAQALNDPIDTALALSEARAVAQAVVSNEVVTTPAFADAVLTRLPADTARRESITKADIQKALSATNQDAQVTLQARWSTEAGAQAIVSAAALALQANPPVPTSVLNPGDSVSVQVAPSTPVVEQDPQRQSDNLNAFIQQALIGLSIALLLPWIFAGLTSARRGSQQPPATP
jgi:hypothetical protein